MSKDRELSEAEVIIKMSIEPEQPTESDAFSSLLSPDVAIVKIKDVIAEMMSSCGEAAYNEFMDLLIYKKIPVVHKMTIVEFLKDRNDLVSICCMKELNEKVTPPI